MENSDVQIEVLLLSASNGDVLETLPDAIVDFLKNDVEIDRHIIQLNMLPDLIMTSLSGSIKR